MANLEMNRAATMVTRVIRSYFEPLRPLLKRQSGVPGQAAPFVLATAVITAWLIMFPDPRPAALCAAAALAVATPSMVLFLTRKYIVEPITAEWQKRALDINNAANAEVIMESTHKAIPELLLGCITGELDLLKLELQAKLMRAEALRTQESAPFSAHQGAAMEKPTEDALRRRSTLCEGVHEIGQISRDLMLAMAETTPKTLDPARAVEALERCCTSIAKMFEELFSSDRPRHLQFRVTIKALCNPEQVLTVARDESTLLHKRHEPDDNVPHPLAKNSAFLELLTYEQTVYACDDLARAHRQKRYQNSSNRWLEFYDATMVVPIRRSMLGTTKTFELVGFIGVDCIKPSDSLNGDIFCVSDEPDKALQALLLGFADLAYGVLKRYRVAPVGNPLGHFVTDDPNFEFIERLHAAYISSAA